jgi:sarcosine oxidase/L-pipecolate oxidase
MAQDASFTIISPNTASGSSLPFASTSASPSFNPTFSSSSPPPSSILIIGSGVFGLSTAYALTRRDGFSKTAITVVDRAVGSDSDEVVFPARDASSIDSSRIIRGDYADPAYAALATEALRQWRKVDSPDDLGAQGRYSESGLVLVADGESNTLRAHVDGAASPAQVDKAKKNGVEYVRASYENAVALGHNDAELASRIRMLPDVDAIRDAVGTGGASGTSGYINGYAGWADAERSMDWLCNQVKQTNRVDFINGTVSELEHADETVTGVKLADGRTLTADLVILATGAWTASLLDLSGQATATGQVIGYLDITAEEQEQLGKMPILLNLTNGLFIIPPVNRQLKVARHAYGYLNPTTPTTTTPLSLSSTKPRTISYPRTSLTAPAALSIPQEGISDLRLALREMLPSHPAIHDRPFAKTRLCWYTDTPTGDFLISYHPRFSGLFVATGGSGHGFKFLPVLGEKIVDAVEGHCPAEFAAKWAWKDGLGEEGDAGIVATEDGSRGGRPGLVLDEELGVSTRVSLPASHGPSEGHTNTLQSL